MNKDRFKHSETNIIAWNANVLTQNKCLEFTVTLNELHTDIVFLIKQNISHSLVDIIEGEKFQVVIAEVSTSLGRFNVAALYSPPKSKCTVDDYSHLLSRLGSKFLIGGDWNCKNTRWGSLIDNPKGSALEEAINLIGGNFISPRKPTFYPHDPNKSPDIIDFFAYNNLPLLNKTTCDVIERKKDHDPVTLCIYIHPILTRKPPCLVSARTDWLKFREKLTSEIDINSPITNINKLDKEVEKLSLQIQTAAKSSTPVAFNDSRKANPLKLPPEIVDMITQKRKARRKMLDIRFFEDKEEYNRLNKIVPKGLNTFGYEKFEKFISSLSPRETDHYTLWKATKSFKRPQQIKFPIQRGDNTNQ